MILYVLYRRASVDFVNDSRHPVSISTTSTSSSRVARSTSDDRNCPRSTAEG